MPLRPRYSLLTLLVLTALIAGGVKLWRGPHHVIDRSARGVMTYEREYYFTRSLSSSKQIHGPVVSRQYRGQQLDGINVEYLRQGKLIVECILDIVDQSKIPPASYKERLEAVLTKLSAEEYSEWRQAIEVEKQRDPGLGWKWVEFLNDKP